MEYVVFATALLLLQYMVLGVRSGLARGKAGLEAPAITGDEVYERRYRVHQNTMEQLVGFIPAMWMFAYFVSPDYASGLAVLFFVGRIVYARSYEADPKSRGKGFFMGFLAFIIALFGAMIGAGMNLV